jgi:HTH-type transcriptional regulator / antitoxin MqsA
VKTPTPRSKASKHCPACGATMVYERRRDPIHYKQAYRTLRTLGWWCTHCDEAILQGPALVARERAFTALRAEVEGVLRPTQVRAIRTRLGLSQRQAGTVLGGGPRAFQKYESGATAVSVPMSNLLRLLANDPTRLKELDPTG